MTEDSELLRRYAENRSEMAFAELVNRRIALVYSVALRQVGGDAHLAQDVTQRVFTDLARKASALARRPVLAGWLYRSTHYAASDVVRSERRRRAREEEHFQMNQMLGGAEGGQADWGRLRPVIDDAMAELDDEDRDAVALRFLEEKSFAEIGRALQLSEDTARKRVERSLDRLHAALAKRGVSSTTQAVALALANQAAAAVPAGLAATVTSGALAGAAGGIGAGILHLMITSKAALGVLGIGAAAAAGFAVVERQAARETQAGVAALTEQRDALQAKVQALEARLNAEAKRAAAAEEDNAKLLSAVRNVQTAQAAAEAAPVTKETIDARYKRAQALARAGNWEAALPEFLWCYDDGMPRISSYSGVRNSFLVGEIGRMAQNYPPAAAALQQRRDRALARLEAAPGDTNSARDYAALNHALGDDARTLQYYDSLSKDDGRRASLMSLSVQELLIDAKRYDDVLAVNPYSRMVSFFETLTRPLNHVSESAALIHRNGVAARGAKNVEVLAGAGKIAEAKQFAEKVLAYNNSPETRQVLQKHLERAGHPNLLGTATP